MAWCRVGVRPMVRGPVSRMLEHQRQALVEGVAVLLDEGAATYYELEHLRVLWGATRDELTELLHDLDTRAAKEYEETEHAMP